MTIRLLKPLAIAALFALSALTLRAQTYVSVADTSSTNSYTSNATQTSNLGNAIDISRQTHVGLLLSFQGSTANAGNVRVGLVRSGDGTTFETTPASDMYFSNAVNGTTAVVGYHEIPDTSIGSAKAIKIKSILNSVVVGDVTNCTVEVVQKKQRTSGP